MADAKYTFAGRPLENVESFNVAVDPDCEVVVQSRSRPDYTYSFTFHVDESGPSGFWDVLMFGHRPESHRRIMEGID